MGPEVREGNECMETEGCVQSCGWVWGLIVYLLQWPYLFRLLLSGGIENSMAKAFKSCLQTESIALPSNIKRWMLLEADFDTLRHLRHWQVWQRECDAFIYGKEIVTGCRPTGTAQWCDESDSRQFGEHVGFACLYKVSRKVYSHKDGERWGYNWWKTFQTFRFPA